MSTRRQRIKGLANLSLVKRKARKQETPAQGTETQEKQENVADAELEDEQQQELQSKSADDRCSLPDAAEEDTVAFKMPATSSGHLDDAFQSDLEDNIIQMDLQKSCSGYPMSPSKAQARQRVRPTPVFGQRRNSFVGSPLAGDCSDGSSFPDYQSPGTPTRRERYLSGSSITGTTSLQQTSQGSPMPQSSYKYFPPVMSPGVGRIRTESSCSVLSDTCSPGGGKQRKIDGGDKLQPQQRVNARRDFETRFVNGVPDKTTFKMFDMIYYNPEANPMEQKPTVTTIKAETTATLDDAKPTKQQLLVAKTEAALPVPQLKLDANGEMIIDEKTLEIETTAEVEARKVLANSSLIQMDETTGDNGFWLRRKRTRGWSAEETVRFYRSLQIIGTDFSLMCEMFPTRTRRDLKLKYKKEERANGQLINKALLYPKAFNIQELKDQLQREDEEKAEADRKWKEIEAAEAKVKEKSSRSNVSKASRTLSDGDAIYENEHVTKARMSKHVWAKRRTALASEAVNDENTKGAGKRRRRQRTTAEQIPQKSSEPTLPPFASIKQESRVKTEQTVCSDKEPEAPPPQLLQQELNSLLSDDEEATAEIMAPEAHPNVESEPTKGQKREKVVINMDDGALNYVSDVESTTTENMATEKSTGPVTPASPATGSATPGITEHDIEQILMELGEGSLVLVSSLDAQSEDRVINEIYMYDKETGDLSAEPLDIPDHIVQCILTVMS
ncbi:transcription factor TFIIIB component B'' homolog [Scaptodrosophila lebanonensis]|uniref:Transcription factor TFIIIB component B'' homolog n=1 Tax=Drosophila lebanonensis TaxID=7225 RepID=A0A6J2TJK5_DROLE|nr:transcription factor TFIIIB component B'' homolog [Scaptodrosophila lebanonensis]